MNEVKFKANIADLNAVQAEVEAIPEIPAPAVADSGKVLTVTVDSSGETPVAEYGLAAPAAELPAIGSSDAGKVLTVNDAHTGVEWKAADALPAIASGDAGKVLTVNAGETAAEWAAAASTGTVLYVGATLQSIPANYLPAVSEDQDWDATMYYAVYKDQAQTQLMTIDELINVDISSTCIHLDTRPTVPIPGWTRDDDGGRFAIISKYVTNTYESTDPQIGEQKTCYFYIADYDDGAFAPVKIGIDASVVSK